MDKSEKKPRNRIAELRKHKGLTIQQVADGIGVSNGTISRYEKGSREPKLETWIKLANFFNVSISYIQGVSDYNNTGGVRFASNDYAIKFLSNHLNNFRDNFADTGQNDLTDQEKINMVDTLLSLKIFLNICIPHKTDDFKLSHTKHEIINKLRELMQLLLDNNNVVPDKTKEIKFEDAVITNNILDKLLELVKKESVTNDEKD